MTRYIMRLDDACPKMDFLKWDRMEDLLDKYHIQPLVGVIPNCLDPDMDKYESKETAFLERVKRWGEKGWELALHGYTHVFETNEGGINPVHRRSEFAGHKLEIQQEKIRNGMDQLKQWKINPKVFIAPAHTFDENTLKAVKEIAGISIISDTVAIDSYYKYDMTFVPQQTGRARKLPFKLVTFCYHPNIMDEVMFNELEAFLESHNKEFVEFPIEETKRKLSLIDIALRKIYFLKKRD